jgi:hypothetical protein
MERFRITTGAPGRNSGGAVLCPIGRRNGLGALARSLPIGRET